MPFSLNAMLLEWREYFRVLWQDAESAQRVYEIAIQQSRSHGDGDELIAENVETDSGDEAFEANIVKLHELVEIVRRDPSMKPLLSLDGQSIECQQRRIKRTI